MGKFTLDSYNALWLIALSLAILWSTRRFKLYGVDEGEARRVISWAFLAMLLGAGLYKPLLRIGSLESNPWEALMQGGLSEIGAVAGAFISAFLLCRNNSRVQFQRLCDVAAPPAFLAIAVGRWGCFLNGCCVGVVSNLPIAVHFPADAAGVFRHPTQLYYSACAVVIIVFLLLMERALLRRRPAYNIDVEREHHAIVAPLALILYSIMRLLIDELRAPVDPILEFPLGRYMLVAGLPFEFIWLTHSIRKITGQAAF